jgi:hypothetical protein
MIYLDVETLIKGLKLISYEQFPHPVGFGPWVGDPNCFAIGKGYGHETASSSTHELADNIRNSKGKMFRDIDGVTYQLNGHTQIYLADFGLRKPGNAMTWLGPMIITATVRALGY